MFVFIAPLHWVLAMPYWAGLATYNALKSCNRFVGLFLGIIMYPLFLSIFAFMSIIYAFIGVLCLQMYTVWVAYCYYEKVPLTRDPSLLPPV